MPSRPRWEPYDPTWLVTLAREQRPELAWLPAALGGCTKGRIESDSYVYFVNPARPNKPGSEWRFHSNIQLVSPGGGLIILDVLSGHRIGGVEFVDNLEARRGLTTA